MFKNNAHRTQATIWRLRAGLIFLTIALVLGGTGQATPARAAPPTGDWYTSSFRINVIRPPTLCVGQQYPIRVTPIIAESSSYQGSRSSFESGIPGVLMKAEMLDPNIATISPASQRNGRIRAYLAGTGEPEYEAGHNEVTFTLTARKVGLTHLILTAQVPRRYSEGRTLFFGPRGMPAGVDVNVVNCKYKVQIYFSMYGFFSGTSGTAMGYMETTLTGDGEYYSGSGVLDVAQARTVPGCATAISDSKSSTNIIGTLNRQNQTLRLEIQYGPAQVSGSISCPVPYGFASNTITEDPATILQSYAEFPVSGGSQNVPITIGGWVGYATIVMKPVDGSAH